VGSQYLKQLVSERNNGVTQHNIVVIPTCVDYEAYPPKDYTRWKEYIDFGWIGGTGNLNLLEIVIPVLNQAAKNHKIRLIVISGREYCPDATFEIINIPWSLGQEIESLRQIDIGLMPLHDTPEDRGKCGFKLIQYMGLGIVSIASAVTTNNEIIDDKVNGFLVYDEKDWLKVIVEVLAASSRYAEIGDAARQKICNKYSFAAHTQEYLDFIKGSLVLSCAA